jgi:hypothetical protein
MPFNAPPSPQSLAARGMALMKTKRAYRGEDGSAALARARTMPWSGRIAKEEPYMSGPYWCWIVRAA